MASSLALIIKLTSSPGAQDLSRLESAAELIQADKKVLISRTRNPVANDKVVSCDLQYLLKKLSEKDRNPTKKK